MFPVRICILPSQGFPVTGEKSLSLQPRFNSPCISEVGDDRVKTRFKQEGGSLSLSGSEGRWAGTGWENQCQCRCQAGREGSAGFITPLQSLNGCSALLSAPTRGRYFTFQTEQYVPQCCSVPMTSPPHQPLFPFPAVLIGPSRNEQPVITGQQSISFTECSQPVWAVKDAPGN